MIPRYMREYQMEWRRYDRFLRVRHSLDTPGQYLLERKTRYLTFPDIPLGTDRAAQMRDSYRPVWHFWPNEVSLVSLNLRLQDLQRLGGAKRYHETLLGWEEVEERLQDARHRADLESVAGELYDRHAWAEKRRVTVPDALESSE